MNADNRNIQEINPEQNKPFVVKKSSENEAVPAIDFADYCQQDAVLNLEEELWNDYINEFGDTQQNKD